jgi:hypothetical protein
MTLDWRADKMVLTMPLSLRREINQMSAKQPPPIVPKKYAGKWIAWDFAQTKIIASARSYEEASTAAKATGETQPVLEKVPDARVRFIGGHL